MDIPYKYTLPLLREQGIARHLVAVILYRRKAVYVRFIGTHAAYDKIDATTI
jgi:mRNA-degrading endonuclease HigB of HigAB toxin-antitoxin module